MTEQAEQQSLNTDETQVSETTEEPGNAGEILEGATVVGPEGEEPILADGAEEAEEEDKKSKIIEVPVSEIADIKCQEDLDQVIENHRSWMDMVLNPKVSVAAGRANLKGCDLRAYDLTGINLSGANLEGVNLQGVELSGANLTATNLRGASMQACNLKGARMFKTKIEDADLRHADLTDAVIRGVDMEFAITSDDDKRLKKKKEDSVIRCGANAIESMSDFVTFDAEDAEALFITCEAETSSLDTF